MILIEKPQIMGLEPTIRGMRNPMNSWAKSDSGLCDTIGDNYGDILPSDFRVGEADMDLMLRLAKAGSVDGKFRRMIAVYVDITAPLYWWKEFDTYKVGTVANSCSTMHKIHAKEFTPEDFSHEHLFNLSNWDAGDALWLKGTNMRVDGEDLLGLTINVLNYYRKRFLATNDKNYWWQMIQLLPSSYNQKRTVMINYEVLANIYQHRRNHKLDEWRTLCQWIEGLPYSKIITCNVVDEKKKQLAAFAENPDRTPVHGGCFDKPIPTETYLTPKDCLILSAYTGVLMCEVDELNKFVEETLGRPVFTHEWATGGMVQDELREKLKPEFIRICGKHD